MSTVLRLAGYAFIWVLVGTLVLGSIVHVFQLYSVATLGVGLAVVCGLVLAFALGRELLRGK